MNKKSINVLLLVEDNPGDARLLREMLREGAATTELKHVGCISDAERNLNFCSEDCCSNNNRNAQT